MTITKVDISGIEKDEDETPLVMVLPDLKSNVKIFQQWKVGHID